jgi:hypothetical protein
MPNPWDNDPIVTKSGPIYGAPAKADSPPSGYAPAGTPIKPLTYVPGGPADPSRPRMPDAGYNLNPDGSETPIKGGPHDPKATGEQLSPEALDAETTNWILTGKMSPMGMGNGPLRVQIQNNRPVVMRKYGISENQLPSMQKMFQADSDAYNKRVSQGSFMQQAEEGARGHASQIEGYLKDLPAQGNATPLNALSAYAQRKMSGETITNLDATIPLLKSEIAKIMTANPSGSGQLTDDARHEFDILEGNVAPARKIEALHALLQMADTKVKANNDEGQRLSQRMIGGLASYSVAGSAPPGGPPHGGGTPPSIPNDPLAPAGGGTKEVVDANLTPVRREYLARLQAGQSGAQLVSFLRQAGVQDPALLRSATEQAKVRRQHPEIPLSKYDTSAIDHITQQMSLMNRAVNAAGQTDLGAGVAAAGNAVTAGFMPDAIGAMGGNETQARLAFQQQQQDHPGAALTGSIAGGTVAALGGEAALGGAGMASGVGRSLLADTAYGGLAGAGSSPDNRTGGAVLGGLAGAGGSLLGQGIAKGASAAFRGVTDKSVNALADSRIPLTVGQAAGQSGRVGRFVKGAEDKATSMPGVGGMINARRTEGYKAFNAKAFDTALAPIRKSVNGLVGEEAVGNARQAVSDAFSAALKGKAAVPDQEFVSAARGPLERLASIKRNDLGPEIVQQIEESTKDLFDPHTGALSGENMQSFLEALRQIRESYKGDPLYARVIKPSVQGIENSVTDMFARQAPEVMPKFNAAKAAYRRVSILADAVDKGKQTEGVFAPSQLGMADRANAKKYDGKLASASGQSPFFDLQRDAQKVLPNKVPDSGTAGRVAMLAAPGALTGAGAGAGFLAGDTKGGAEVGLGLTGILALAYTRAGQARLAKMLLSRNPRARAIAEQITKRVPIAGAAGTALTQTSGDR